MWPAARNTLVSSPQSVARSPQSECGPQPAARNLRPAACNLSVARNPQPAICDPQPAARNAISGPQPAARNLASLVEDNQTTFFLPYSILLEKRMKDLCFHTNLGINLNLLMVHILRCSIFIKMDILTYSHIRILD